jgi:hypothetical protein
MLQHVRGAFFYLSAHLLVCVVGRIFVHAVIKYDVAPAVPPRTASPLSCASTSPLVPLIPSSLSCPVTAWPRLWVQGCHAGRLSRG